MAGMWVGLVYRPGVPTLCADLVCRPCEATLCADFVCGLCVPTLCADLVRRPCVPTLCADLVRRAGVACRCRGSVSRLSESLWSADLVFHAVLLTYVSVPSCSSFFPHSSFFYCISLLLLSLSPFHALSSLP